MKTTHILILMLCAVLTFSLVACNEGDASENTNEQTTQAPAQTSTEAPTEKPTETPTEAPTETTTQDTTEQPSEAPTEQETELLGRDDYAEDDPSNPYLNLIEVGMSYDGVTKCYDGRYDFGYPVCAAGGIDFSCVQDAIDYLEGTGGNISIKEDIDICLRLMIPDDGEFYRIFYNCHNCDFVYNYGVVYDDQVADPVSGIFGYAYYSDLWELDYIDGLENTYTWIFTEYEGFAPGRYLMTVSEDAQSEYYYGYEKVAEIFEWPGLPLAEYLPE